VDLFLTDTYDFSTGATGATGKLHDWNISKKIVEIAPRPVILAGGLTPDNVRLGIDFVRPHGVDAHTGVEDDSGKKDPVLVTRFVEQSMVGFAGKKLQHGCT
jgi:phosphoribosylanthranilate isomerase